MHTVRDTINFNNKKKLHSVMMSAAGDKNLSFGTNKCSLKEVRTQLQNPYKLIMFKHYISMTLAQILQDLV